MAVQADVSSEADVLRLFKTMDEKLGRLTVLVNNAGIVDRSSRVEAMSAERIQRMLAINVTGSFLCAREAVKRMSTRHGGKGGAIVNVSSMAAKLGAAGDYVDYAASKAVIRTEIHASSGDPARAERIGAAAPLQRAGEAEEVARTILWLASGEASYITGALLDVSGGR